MTATEVRGTIPKITIILPVYNVAEFLPRCLQSIEAQTFRDFCVIAVNDGATDASPRLLREFAAAHSYCTLVEQENQGIAAARNTGLALAETEYVTFLDSDDFIAPTFLQELYDACQQNRADIACCSYDYYDPIRQRGAPHPFRCAGVYSREQAMKKLLRDLQIQSYAWNKLYKRRLFAENNITYPTMAFEDMATTHRVFRYANRVVALNRTLYHYTQHKASILKTPSRQKINDFIRATASIRVSLENDGGYRQYRWAYGDLCRKTGFYCGYHLAKIHWNERTPKGFGRGLMQIQKSLRFCRSRRFDAAKLTGKTADRLPEPLPMPATAEKCGRGK